MTIKKKKTALEKAKEKAKDLTERLKVQLERFTEAQKCHLALSERYLNREREAFMCGFMVGSSRYAVEVGHSGMIANNQFLRKIFEQDMRPMVEGSLTNMAQNKAQYGSIPS